MLQRGDEAASSSRQPDSSREAERYNSVGRVTAPELERLHDALHQKEEQLASFLQTISELEATRDRCEDHRSQRQFGLPILASRNRQSCRTARSSLMISFLLPRPILLIQSPQNHVGQDCQEALTPWFLSTFSNAVLLRSWSIPPKPLRSVPPLPETSPVSARNSLRCTTHLPLPIATLPLAVALSLDYYATLHACKSLAPALFKGFARPGRGHSSPCSVWKAKD